MKHAPNINFETKPKITFNLDPVLQGYCRFLFKTSPEKRFIILSRKKDIGKLIFAHIQSGDIRIKQPLFESPVTFILPMPNNEHGYWMRYRFIYVPKWVEEKFTDAIEYEFKKWVERMFELGYQKRYEQKHIIEAILRGLDLRNNKDNYERIKKIDYRKRRREEEIRFNILVSDLKLCV